MKKTMLRRGLAWLLVLVMTLSAVPFGVFAEEAPQGEGTSQAENENPPVCTCAEQAKCTMETPNAACPVCSAEGADLDTCCSGKTQEQLDAEAAAAAVKKAAEEEAAKKAAEEESAQKAAEEEAAKKAAEEEAAQKAREEAAQKAAEEETARKAADEAKKTAEEEEAAKKAAEEAARKASEEAVKDVQEKINALPAADTITAENRGEVEEALTAIDDAKEKLTDEEREKLNLTRYNAAADALKEMPAPKNGGDGSDGPVNSVPQLGTVADPQTGDRDEPNITFAAGEIVGSEILPAGFKNPKFTLNSSNEDLKSQFLSICQQKSFTPENAEYVLHPTWTKESCDSNISEYALDFVWVDETNNKKYEWDIDGAIDHPVYFLNFSISWSIEFPTVSQGLLEYRTDESFSNIDDTEGASEIDVKTGKLSFTNSRRTGNAVCFYVNDPATVTFHANAEDVDNITLPDKITSFWTGTVDLSQQKATRPGYIFKGWSTSNGTDAAEKMVTSLTMNADNIDLYAVWEQVNITLTGDGVTEQTVHPNSDGKLDKKWFELTREGLVFRGWKDEGGNIVSESTVFDKDTTLTALWTPVQTDNCVMELEPLTKEQFDLWMKGAEYNPNRYIPDDWVEVYGMPRAPKEELRSKAKGVLGTENVRLIGLDIGVTLKIGATIPVTDTQKTIRFTLPVNCLDFGGKLTILRTHDGEITEIPKGKPQDDTKEGWYLDDEGQIHLAARYFSDYAVAYVPYTVTFDSKGGSSCLPETTLIDGTLDNLPTPTRTGYTFDGWYRKNADGTEAKVEEKVTVFAADTTVYAKWIPWTYTVTFDGNGGKVKNSVKTSETVSAVSGTAVTPPEFEKDYYRVSAWARNADGTNKVSSPIRDLAAKDGDRITLYAVWEYVPRTVTFDADGGKITENKQTLASVTRTTQEDPINTLKAADLPVPDSREGWFFGGWYTQKDGKGDLVKAGSTEFKTDSTVYAYWIAFEPVTVTLKCRQGSMTVDGKNVTTGTMQTKWPGVLDGTMPTPARTGYKFLGWYTAAGIKVDENTVFLKDTTLYARWVSAVSSSGNPRTGDQVRLGLAVGILAVAAVGLTAAIVIRKRKK